MVDIYKSKFTGQEIDNILTNASNVTNIEANPSGEATEELTKITIGGTTYSIPEGTEGTVVEANPSGDATVELTKLKIGNTIYSIPQENGGGGESTQRGYTIRAGTNVQFRYITLADGTNISNPTENTYDNVAYFTCTVTPTSMPCYLSLPVSIYCTYISFTFGELKASFRSQETLTPNGNAVVYNVVPFCDGAISVVIGGGSD